MNTTERLNSSKDAASSGGGQGGRAPGSPREGLGLLPLLCEWNPSEAPHPPVQSLCQAPMQQISCFSCGSGCHLLRQCHWHFSLRAVVVYLDLSQFSVAAAGKCHGAGLERSASCDEKLTTHGVWVSAPCILQTGGTSTGSHLPLGGQPLTHTPAKRLTWFALQILSILGSRDHWGHS